MNETMRLSGRDYAADVLKAIAIFGVLTIHGAAYGYGAEIASLDWIAAVFWGSVSRASVPLFFMCSGALMLDPRKDFSLKKLYTKWLPRLVIAMLFWAVIYKLYHLAEEHALTGENFIFSLKQVLLFDQEMHFYYLHIIFIVYFFLPVTRIFAEHAGKRLLEYFLILWFVLGILYPTALHFWPFTLLGGIPKQWALNMTYAAVGYGLLGYYIKFYGQNIKKYVYFLSFFVGFAMVFGFTVIGSVKNQQLYTLFWEGMSPGTAFMAAGIFGLVYSAFWKKEQKKPRRAEMVSKASFCIYLVHLLFLQEYAKRMLFSPYLLSVPVIAAAAFLFGFAVYLVLSRIPIAKKWLI